MSKVAELQYDILEMHDQGIRPQAIADILDVELDMVYDVLQEAAADAMEAAEDFEPLDYEEDDADALASAGFGMDEDYRSFEYDEY